MRRWYIDSFGVESEDSEGQWVEYNDHQQALAEKDREIANLQTCQCEGCDNSLEGEAYCQSCWMKLREAHHALMKQAVEFAENTIYIMGALCSNRHELETNGHVLRAREFLASPEVRTWREQGKP